MAESVRDFFEQLPQRADTSKMAGMRNSYLFEIDGAGTWRVDVNDGAISVVEGASDADVTIRTSEDTFEGLVAGDVNPIAAYMQKKIRVSGDMGAAMKLQKILG
jgi:putative sterol carrier protein